MTFGNKAYVGYTPYKDVILIALSYFLAKENNDFSSRNENINMDEF